MAKKKKDGKLTESQEKKSKKLAKKLKKHPKVTNPFALANFIVQRQTRRKKK